MKNVLAVVAGILIFFLIGVLTKITGDMIFPLSEELNPRNKEDLIKHTATLPFVAFVYSWIGSALSCIAAIFLALKIAESEYQKIALITTGILVFFGISIITAFPQPWWHTIITILIYLGATHLTWKHLSKSMKV